MKRFALFAALLLIAAVSFAQEQAQEQEQPKEREIEFFDLELSIGVPIHWTNSSPTPHEFYGIADKDKTVTANTAFGIGLNFNFTKKIGAHLEVDFFFGTIMMGQSETSSASNTLMGLNAFIGPVFYLVNHTNLRIPLAVGAHAYMWSTDYWSVEHSDAGSWISTFDLQFGPGVKIGVQFHFNKDLYLFSSTSIAIDLYRSHETTTSDGTVLNEDKNHSGDFGISWVVKPSLGLGVKY
jgi:hypothetical protein